MALRLWAAPPLGLLPGPGLLLSSTLQLQRGWLLLLLQMLLQQLLQASHPPLPLRLTASLQQALAWCSQAGVSLLEACMP